MQEKEPEKKERQNGGLGLKRRMSPIDKDLKSPKDHHP
jgi:hypothetical protein